MDAGDWESKVLSWVVNLDPLHASVSRRLEVCAWREGEDSCSMGMHEGSLPKEGGRKRVQTHP